MPLICIYKHTHIHTKACTETHTRTSMYRNTHTHTFPNSRVPHTSAPLEAFPWWTSICARSSREIKMPSSYSRVAGRSFEVKVPVIPPLPLSPSEGCEDISVIFLSQIIQRTLIKEGLFSVSLCRRTKGGRGDQKDWMPWIGKLGDRFTPVHR